MKHTVAFLLVALALGGCYAYPPVSTPSPQERFDRSFRAAIGAMVDQGLDIVEQDRGAGVIRGNRGGIVITAEVRTLPNGSIKVEFGQSGATNTDPELMRRVSKDYHRRMGR